MARRTIEVIQCDRCDVDIPAPHYGGEAGTYSLRFEVDYGVAGKVVNWKELCSECNSYLCDFIERELGVARHKRKET